MRHLLHLLLLFMVVSSTFSYPLVPTLFCNKCHFITTSCCCCVASLWPLALVPFVSTFLSNFLCLFNFFLAGLVSISLNLNSVFCFDFGFKGFLGNFCDVAFFNFTLSNFLSSCPNWIQESAFPSSSNNSVWSAWFSFDFVGYSICSLSSFAISFFTGLKATVKLFNNFFVY